MSDDPLDTVTSVSVDITEAGVQAKAKSRLIAAIDRLGGNLFEIINAPMERRVGRERAMIAGEKKVIEAIVDFGVKRLQRDPEFAERVAEKHLGRLFGRQDNKDGVINWAIEDLRQDPLTEIEAKSGNPELDTQFMDRFERYAEDASTDELRERWGRVLSAEIRKPGTFSAKVLRIVDEIEPPTARIFEKLCESMLANVLPKSLVGELSFSDVTSLTTAGLLVEPGMGQIRSANSITGSDGVARWVLNLGEFGFALPKEVVIPTVGIADFGKPDPPIGLDDVKNPCIPVYVLTEAGSAVAEILPNNRRAAFLSLMKCISSYVPSAQVVPLELNPLRSGYIPVRQ